MSYIVHIKPSGYTFTVHADETIYQAAQRQGYLFPQGHRDNHCTACKGQLLQGQVSYLNQSPDLTDEDRETGYALFCAATPQSDLVIHLEQVNYKLQQPVKKFTYLVTTIELLSGNVYRVLLKPATHEHLQFKAGQYLEILHRDSSPKPFSIANSPAEDGHLELHIRYLPDNPYTIELLEEIKTKQQLRIAGPYGKSIYRKEPDYPMIFLAGGTGFAPLKAIIEQAFKEEQPRMLHLYWGARTYQDLYLPQLPQQWLKDNPQFRYTPVLSAPLSSDHWQGRTGLVHEAVPADYPDLAAHHVYASGPPEMVYAALRAFQAHGLNRSLMYSDWFDYEAK